MDRIKYLILAFLREELSPAEQAELDSWRRADPANEQLLAELQDPARVAGALAKLDQLHRQEAWAKVELHAQAVRAAEGGESKEANETGEVFGKNEGSVGVLKGRIRRMTWTRVGMVAASVAILVAGTWYFWNSSAPKTPPPKTVAAAIDVQPPATNKATLTLANGQHIVLDSAGNGLLASQGGAQIQKTSNGLVAYVPAAAGASAPTAGPIVYNTLSNPRGSRTVTLTLSDGTRVWLNAESSLRYPVVFTGRDRTVEISGEGYFEVKRKADQPFIVDIKNQAKIEVLGTTFNVNAYEDEDNIKATLLEGAVRVTLAGSPNVGGNTSRHKSVVLRPGEQAQVVGSGTNHGVTGDIRLVEDANVEQAVAWRNGNFQFDGDDIGEVMRQLSRWYAVEVKYETKPQVHYTGGISRDLNISKVLDMLALSGLHCRIDSNTVVVLP